MATMYSAICKDCRHEFEYTTGPLMTGGVKVCDRCGDSKAVPNLAPKGSYELSKAGLADYMRSENFDLYGREFTIAEENNLENLTRFCTCGGRMVFDDGEGSVKHRCPQCRSANLDIDFNGCVD